MLKFKAQDTYTIKSRGQVFTGPATFEIEKKRNLLGQLVEIEYQGFTRAYTVTGVETFPTNDNIKPGDPIGLLVSDH